MKKINNKIIIGTANFSNNYGLKKKKLSQKKINDLLKTATKYHLNIVDTAQSYGNSEKIIGKFKTQYNLQVITKLPTFKKKLKKNEIKNLILKSNLNLKKKKIDYLLFHNVKDFLKSNFHYPKKVNQFKGIYFKKLGVSVYSPREFLQCIKYKNLNCVQIPYNILDYRWNKINFEKIKKSKKIEIHVRSIFLKGILPNRIKSLPSWFKEKTKLFNKINRLTKLYNMKFIDICTLYVFEQNWIDKVIIGFSKTKQIEDIFKIVNKKKKINFNNNLFKFLPEKILMPKNW